jgi:hypothetical protein
LIDETAKIAEPANIPDKGDFFGQIKSDQSVIKKLI